MAEMDGYIRHEGCVGLYLDALDARPDKQTTVGSQHAFMMAVMDKMMEYLLTLDLPKVKGAFESRKVGDGMVLEGFKQGCVLLLTFDTPAALESLWSLHVKGRLSTICQDIFVEKSLLRATNSVKLTLRAKLWEDEYKVCLTELSARPSTRLKLSGLARDLQMVTRVHEYQKSLQSSLSAARDAEAQFEHGLGEFMMTIKQCLPDATTRLRNVKEFQANMKMARGVHKTSFQPVHRFWEALELFRKIFTELEQELVQPLLQVRAACETEKQKNLKATIKKACAEILNNLKPEADLQSIRHKEWEVKVLQRERGLFLGLISLIPMSLDRLLSIDLNTDEYVNDFPEMAGK